jgi:preprotein translocase subunit YajC
METIFSTLASAAVLFAQEPEKPAGDSPLSFLQSPLPMFVVIGVLFYFMLIRPQRKEQARRQQMLTAVKKNDRVVTNAGIYGVVTNVHREADEVTIKVDETTNTKLRMTLSSVARVLGDEPADESANK